jgi:YegS/Rv2252/BmrU family lipid kinase
MTTVAVVAHTGKSTGGGLIELRHRLAEEGVTEPLWFEVPKSKRAPKRVRTAIDAGADLVLVWGGDGTVQRCVDALEGTDVAMGVVPAGTANLFATNLGIPQHIAAAVRIALHGARTRLDVGRINGERFAVMAGVGVDALMIRDADSGLKDRIGRLAYVVTGASDIRLDPFHARIKVDRTSWFDGDVSSVLVGNVGTILGGIEAFEDARPDDGVLEIGVVTADGAVEWARTLARAAVGTTARSPFVQTVSGRRVRIKLDREMPYELDGGDRPATRSLKVDVEPAALTVCVPPSSTFARPALGSSVGERGARS